MKTRSRTGAPISELLFAAVVVASVGAIGILGGCNTTEGIGKDVKAAGKGIENTAQDAKN